MIGMFMFLQNPNLDSGLVFLEALATHLPAGLLPVGVVLFFAGLMSSADTNVYAIASHYVLSRKSEKPVYDIRITTFVLGILSIVIGYFFRDIVDLTIVVGGVSLVLSVAMLYLIAGGSNVFRYIGSVTGGVIGFIAGLLVFGIQPIAAITVLAGSLLGLVYKGWFIQSHSQKTSIAGT